MRRLSQSLARLFEVSDPKGRILPMEGMRGFAVGLVFFVHFFDFFHGYITPDSILFPPFYFLSHIGNLGVDLFFVISDYLIYGILLRRDQTYFRFWRRRIVRIYPVFILAFFTYVVLSYALPGFDKIGHPPGGTAIWLALNFLLLPGIFTIRPLIMVAWSLSYEFLYYLFSPLVVGGLRMWAWAQRWRLALVAAVYAAGFGWLCLYPDERGRLLLFLAGIFLYEAKRGGLLDRRPHPLNEAGAFVFLALAFWVFFDLHFNALLWDGPRFLQIGFDRWLLVIPLFSAAFFYLGFVTLRPAGFAARLFAFRPLRYLGNMSYTVYLFHVLALDGVRWCAHRWTPPRGDQEGLFLLYLVLGATAVVLLSAIIFAVVEKPLSLTKRTPVALPGI